MEAMTREGYYKKKEATKAANTNFKAQKDLEEQRRSESRTSEPRRVEPWREELRRVEPRREEPKREEYASNNQQPGTSARYSNPSQTRRQAPWHPHKGSTTDSSEAKRRATVTDDDWDTKDLPRGARGQEDGYRSFQARSRHPQPPRHSNPPRHLPSSRRSSPP